MTNGDQPAIKEIDRLTVSNEIFDLKPSENSFTLEDTVVGFPMVKEAPGIYEGSLDVMIKRISDYRIGLCDVDGGFKPSYKFDEVGYFKIHGAKNQEGYRPIMPGLFHGRFVDVIAYAVQQPEFYPENGSLGDARNANAGYIEMAGFQAEEIVQVRKRDYINS